MGGNSDIDTWEGLQECGIQHQSRVERWFLPLQLQHCSLGRCPWAWDLWRQWEEAHAQLCLLLARVCTSVLLGILGCQFSFESYQPAWDVPLSHGSHLLCLPPVPSDMPHGLSSSAHVCGSTQGCSVSKAALPPSPRVVGLIKVSVFCTGDCVGLSQTGFAPALGAEPSKPTAGAFSTGRGLAMSVVDLVLAPKLIHSLTA